MAEFHGDLDKELKDQEVPERVPRSINDIPETFQAILRYKQRKKGMTAQLPDGSIWRTDHMMYWREIEGSDMSRAGSFSLGNTYRKNRGLTRAEVKEIIKQQEAEEEARKTQELERQTPSPEPTEDKGTHKIVDKR